MTETNMAALFGTMFVLAAAPGPSDFAVIGRSLSSGFASALAMICGIIVADFVFIIAAVYGLAAAADALGDLFVLVRYAGGGYLIWLGLAAFMARPQPAQSEETDGGRHLSSFAAGALITFGDPKAIVFYVSLLPGFVDLSTVSIGDTLTIMLLAALAVGTAKSVYAYAADRAALLLENSAVQKKMEITAGTVLIATGAFLIAAA